MGARDLAELLVLRVLAGMREDVEALRMYLLDGMGFSEVADLQGRPKHVVRSRVQRAVYAAGGRRAAAAVLSRLYPVLGELEPVVRGGVCGLCGARTSRPLQHLRRRHGALVYLAVGTVLRVARR